MSNIFFTSDTHFGHGNISGKNESRWKSGYRHYPSLHEMNKDLTSQINKIVKPDDTLYHLGDWSFGGIENIWKFRKQIMCKNIHLILGNHDHHIEEDKVLPNVISSVPYGGYDTFIDGNPNDYGVLKAGDGEYPNYVTAQRLFSSVSHYKEIKVGGKIIVLSHYAHRVWHGSHKGWLHFYAHSHDSLPPLGKSHDVGVDTAIRLTGEARPFYSGEIIQLVDNLPVEFVDHHDQSTNTGKPQGHKGRRK